MSDPGDVDDDLPPLVGENGQEESVGAWYVTAPVPSSPAAPDAPHDCNDLADHAGILLAAEALCKKAAARQARDGPDSILPADALRAALSQAEEPKGGAKPPCAQTIRMLEAIARDDFDECEDCILRGADVNADCGAGMRAIHMSALRGEMFLTELLIRHSADVNQRDASGNTPLIYTCHFYKQHGKGVELTAQLLYHKADPFFRVRDGKFSGDSALDLMERACREPQIDENPPRQMRAMIELATHGREESAEAVTKMWMHFKSQHKRLYDVSCKRDNYDYAVKSVDWVLPGGKSCEQAYAPAKLGGCDLISDEKFTAIENYSFTDEGDKVKVYVSFPDEARTSLSDSKALAVEFDFQSFDVWLTTPAEKFRLRVDPLYGSIEVAQCKHRVSAGSAKVSLTLVKRHKNRVWSAIQKPR